MQTKQRLNWIDMAKGYGMLLIIAGHLGDYGAYNFIKIWFFSFHVPLFFFLSGFVFKDSDGFSTFLKKKLRSIVVPYFCLGITVVIFRCLWDYNSGTFTADSTIELLTGFLIQKRNWSIWFLACLFMLNLLFYVAKKVLKTNLLLSFFSVFCVALGVLYYYLGGKFLPWNIDASFMAFPFFFGGYYYKQRYNDVKKLFEKKYRIALLFVSLIIVNVLLCYINFSINGRWFNMYDSRYGFAPITYISAFAGIGFTLILSELTLLKTVRYVGENSILYMAWHDEIMIPIAEKCLIVFCSVLSIKYESIHILMRYLIYMILIVSIITILNIAITHTKLRFILGKRNLTYN